MAMILQKILANYLSARDARGTKDCEAKKGLVTLEKASHRCIPTTGLIAKEWQGTVRQDCWSSLQSCSWESLEIKLVGVSMEPLAEHSWGNRCTFIMSICSNLYPWEVTGLASSRHFELWAPPMGWLSGPFIEDRGVNSSTSQTKVLHRTVSQRDTYHLVILTAIPPSYCCKLCLSDAGTICFVV